METLILLRRRFPLPNLRYFGNIPNVPILSKAHSVHTTSFAYSYAVENWKGVGLGAWGLGFGVWGLGLRAWGLGLGAWS